MYDLSVPALQRGLGVLSRYLDKASAYATERGFEPSILVNARLAPDMLPLVGQVQRASDTSKGGIARLTGLTAPSFPDTETTIDELKERIARTVAFLQTVTPATARRQRGAADRDPAPSAPCPAQRICWGSCRRISDFRCCDRRTPSSGDNGVPVGKKDYLGANSWTIKDVRSAACAVAQLIGRPAQDVVQQSCERSPRWRSCHKARTLQAGRRIGQFMDRDRMGAGKRLRERPRRDGREGRVLQQRRQRQKCGSETAMRGTRSAVAKAASKAARSHISDRRASPRSEMKPSTAPSCSPPNDTTTSGSVARMSAVIDVTRVRDVISTSS